MGEILSCTKPKQHPQNVENTQTCDICTENIKEKLILPCKHYFHSTCINQHIKTRISEKALVIHCPTGCGREIPYDFLQKILKAQQFQIHQKNLLQSLIQNQDQYLFCPTANCVAIYQIAGEDFQFFQCLFCKNNYCLICRKAKHQDKDCDFQEERLSKAVMTKAGMKPCPYCGRMIDKIAGCNAVQCKCGNQFCHDCGGTKCPHGTCLKKVKK